MTLTVGYDATAAARQGAGIGRYARDLLGAMLQLPDDLRFRAYYFSGGALEGSLPDSDGRLSARGIPISDRVANLVWQRLRLPVPVQALTGPFDVFHSPDFTLPPTFGRPAVLTVHDLAFLRVPDCAFPTLRRYLEQTVPRSVRRADRVIAVSESTRRDLIELLGVPPERVVTIYEGVSEEFKPMSRERARDEVESMGVPGPYLLAVGTLEPRKNYVRLLHAFRRLLERDFALRLVIAGGPGWLYQPIFETLSELNLEDSVSFVRPGDPALRALYAACEATVYPSLYEGFGIPPLEALSCGAALICSNAASLPEVVGESAVLFDPTDVESMRTAIEEVLVDQALRQRLRQAGPARAAAFPWAAAARKTIEVYRELATNA